MAQPIDLVHVQADENKVKLQGYSVWMALMVSPRLWLGFAAGAVTYLAADRWVDHRGGSARLDIAGDQQRGSGTGILL